MNKLLLRTLQNEIKRHFKAKNHLHRGMKKLTNKQVIELNEIAIYIYEKIQKEIKEKIENV